MEIFKYQKSLAVNYWGCGFDSLLELKYAISIQQDYYFLRAQIPIYFDPKTRTPTNYLRYNTRRYTPDFLIRHKQTGKAFLVEIKPQGFNDDKQLALRKELAEKYIRIKKFDWAFIIVNGDSIKLTTEQQEEYDKCYRSKIKSFYDEGYNTPAFLKSPQGNKQVKFIMYGF